MLVPSGVGYDKVGVQLRIELPRGGVAKGCCTEIAGGLAVVVVSLGPAARSVPHVPLVTRGG